MNSEEKTQAPVTFRFALREDVPLILRFIKELADYEGLLQEVVATEALLEQWLFEKQTAQVLLAQWEGEAEPVGFALFFHNFSTFLGRAGIYLEDLYVKPDFRNKGIGKAFLGQLVLLAKQLGCGRLEWWCLDSNTPAVAFYQRLGAEPMADWTVYRIAGQRLETMAQEYQTNK